MHGDFRNPQLLLKHLKGSPREQLLSPAGGGLRQAQVVGLKDIAQFV